MQNINYAENDGQNRIDFTINRQYAIMKMC